jgi:hypothetical protein
MNDKTPKGTGKPGRDAATEARECALAEEIANKTAKQQPRPSSPLKHSRTISYTELPEGKADSPLQQEWNTYRREIGRLLAEGHEGRYVLIKGEEIIGICDTREEARSAALDKFLLQPCLIHQILSREPLLRGPSVLWRCRS